MKKRECSTAFCNFNKSLYKMNLIYAREAKERLGHISLGNLDQERKDAIIEAYKILDKHFPD